MAPASSRSRLAFPLVLLMVAVAGFLPAPWLGWVSDVKAIVDFPIRPVSHVFSVAAGWLRPGPDEQAEARPDSPEAIRRLREERDLYEQMYLAAQQEIRGLEEQLEQLRLVPVEQLQVEVSRVSARIIARHPTDAQGIVELRAGERQRVEPGAIGVYGGVHLLGRVAQVDGFTSQFQPVTNPATGLLGARLFPPDRRDAPVTELPFVTLEPDGEGNLVGDIDRAHDVAVGDVVRLDDGSWPRSAQMMTLGRIARIEPKDEQPLRQRIIVRPRYRVSGVSRVTLLLERDQRGGGDR